MGHEDERRLARNFLDWFRDKPETASAIFKTVCVERLRRIESEYNGEAVRDGREKYQILTLAMAAGSIDDPEIAGLMVEFLRCHLAD